MSSPPSPARLVLTTNIPTPYRIAFFKVLDGVLRERDIAFEVLYYAATEPNRRWQIDLSSQSYPWHVLPGVHPNLGVFYPHLNPSLPFVLRSRNPTWVLIAGAWNTPSSLLAASRSLSGPGHRLFWSEGHAAAVLHSQGPIAALRRRVLSRFDGFVVPNQASEDFLATELGHSPVSLRLPNTVDEAFYLAGPGVPRAENRRSLSLNETDVVVLCVAELVERKGVVELAEAMAALPPELRRRALLVFAGQGQLETEVLRAASLVRSRLLGHVSAEVVRAWLHAADLFVLPSKVDPNPLSAIEAAFCGLPLLLSSRAGNARDLVSGGESGWLFPEVNVSAMVPILTAAIAAPDSERRRMGDRAQRLARAEFSREACAQRFADQLCERFPRSQQAFQSDASTSKRDAQSGHS